MKIEFKEKPEAWYLFLILPSNYAVSHSLWNFICFIWAYMYFNPEYMIHTLHSTKKIHTFLFSVKFTAIFQVIPKYISFLNTTVKRKFNKLKYSKFISKYLSK